MSAADVNNLWAASGLVTVLMLAVLLTRRKALQWLSPPVLALLLAATLANFGLLPRRSDAAFYGVLSGAGLQTAIFLLLLQVDFAAFRRAGTPMILCYLAGAAGIASGVVLTTLVAPIAAALGDAYPTLAGMYAATYVGGNVNLVAVAAALGLDRAGNDFVVAIAVDNVISMMWLAGCIVVAPLMSRRARTGDAAVRPPGPARPPMPELHELALLAFATVACIALARAAAGFVPGVHTILWLTTIALVVAQTPLGRIGPPVEPIAVLLLYLFIAAIGVEVSFAALIDNAALALALLGIILIAFSAHALFVFVAARVLKVDSDVALVASQAGIGGPPTAVVLAEAIGRSDLRVPGIATGLLGYAIGTYAGLGVAFIVRALA